MPHAEHGGEHGGGVPAVRAARGGVLVFGDLIDDVIVVPSGPIRPDTDTASSIRARPGGSAANTAAWLASVGVRVAFSGRCARMDAARHADHLTAAGVAPLVDPDDDLPTGTIIVIVEGDHRTMLTERGANAVHSPASIEPSGRELVHATGYSLIGYADEYADLVRRVHAVGGRVSLNTGSVQAIEEIGVERFRTAIADVDVLVATAAEAALLTGVDEPDAAAAALGSRHPFVAVTAGRDGAWVAGAGTAGDTPRNPGDGTVTRIPAERADAVDPTGAGDAFTAGFLAGFLSGMTAPEAARDGVALAARAVTTMGARPA